MAWRSVCQTAKKKGKFSQLGLTGHGIRIPLRWYCKTKEIDSYAICPGQHFYFSVPGPNAQMALKGCFTPGSKPSCCTAQSNSLLSTKARSCSLKPCLLSLLSCLCPLLHPGLAAVRRYPLTAACSVLAIFGAELERLVLQTPGPRERGDWKKGAKKPWRLSLLWPTHRQKKSKNIAKIAKFS